MAMNQRRKSDRPVVPAKPPNKSRNLAAEGVEGRGVTKGNSPQQNAVRTQSREEDAIGKSSAGDLAAHSALERIRQAAKRDKKCRFTSLMHHICNPDALRQAYYGLRREASAGVDGETWQSYGERLEENLLKLSEKLKRGAYRATPVRRVYIPKADGTERPLGVTSFEDKVVQRATVEVLKAIYETDFLGFSYGYRPGRGQHNALDALYVGILTKYVNWVLDGDIRSFFDRIDHEWLVKFIEHRVGDQRVVRLIRKWLKAGVLEDGEWRSSEEGTPQGGSASPLMANIFMHYVFDLWVQQWRKTKARGDVIVVRWADDFVVGFRFKSDAEQFHRELAERFQKFKLELHPEKTRLIEFGPFAAQNRKVAGKRRPETFNFLGFTHICAKKRSNGRFTVNRRTIAKRARTKLSELKIELRRRLHDPVPDVGKWLGSVVGGHNRYYGVPGNWQQLFSFRSQVSKLWFRTLRRRSQTTSLTWKRMNRLVERWLPPPTIHHPYPLTRFGVRPEVGAGCVSSARPDLRRG
jgi:group II intron reverse transcriptase/maturase